jgi:hypothetical protein
MRHDHDDIPRRNSPECRFDVIRRCQGAYLAESIRVIGIGCKQETINFIDISVSQTIFNFVIVLAGALASSVSIRTKKEGPKNENQQHDTTARYE